MEESSIDNFTEEIDSSPTMNQLYFEEPAVLMITRLTIEVTLAFMGLVGNAVVSFVISRQNKFRSGLKVFIRNLALADIGILAISFPIAVVKEQLPFYWPFGRVICLYFYPLAEVFHGVSVWSITAIAIERYRKMDHVYLRHLSTEYRSILAADMPTDSRPISRPILGRHIDRRQRTRMSADTRPILHRHSADSWPVHYRHSADHVLLYRPSIGRYYRSVCRPTVGRYLDRYSADMSAETRPTYRPTSTDTHVS